MPARRPELALPLPSVAALTVRSRSTRSFALSSNRGLRGFLRSNALLGLPLFRGPEDIRSGGCVGAGRSPADDTVGVADCCCSRVDVMPAAALAGEGGRDGAGVAFCDSD